MGYWARQSAQLHSPQSLAAQYRSFGSGNPQINPAPTDALGFIVPQMFRFMDSHWQVGRFFVSTAFFGRIVGFTPQDW